MNTATVLLIVLSHSGHWLAGTNATITARWSAAVDVPKSVLLWELKYGTVTLANGKTDLAGSDATAHVDFVVPDVRTQTMLRWTYRLVNQQGGNEITHGEQEIHAYPAHLLSDCSERYADRSVMVMDESGVLVKTLERAKIQATSVAGVTSLALAQPDVLIVGPDAIGASPLESPAFEAMAEAGTQVLVFKQIRCGRIGPDLLLDRHSADPVTWNLTHPLLAGFDSATLDNWLRSDDVAKVVALSGDEPTLPVACFKREALSVESVPTDAIIFSRTVGRGRLICVQLPMNDWDSDPRALVLLNNALGYLLTRPEPAQAPQNRGSIRAVLVAPEHRILVGG